MSYPNFSQANTTTGKVSLMSCPDLLDARYRRLPAATLGRILTDTVLPPSQSKAPSLTWRCQKSPSQGCRTCVKIPPAFDRSAQGSSHGIPSSCCRRKSCVHKPGNNKGLWHRDVIPHGLSCPAGSSLAEQRTESCKVGSKVPSNNNSRTDPAPRNLCFSS